MCGNSSGKKLIIFSLTFAVGFSFNVIFNFESSNQKLELPNQEVEKIQQEVKLEKSENQPKNSSRKPLCKRYRDDFYIELIQKREELVYLLREKHTTPKQKKYYGQEIDKLDKELERKSKKQKKQNKESENLSSKTTTSRNLLYVENCVEY